MNRKLGILVVTLIIAVTGGLMFAIQNSTTGLAGSSQATTTAKVVASGSSSKAGASIVVDDEPVVKIGTVSCLKAKNTNGPQVTSCAVGVFDTDGKAYALYSDDPTTVGSLLTGQRIQVTGLLKQQNTEFDIYGVIVIRSLKILE